MKQNSFSRTFVGPDNAHQTLAIEYHTADYAIYLEGGKLQERGALIIRGACGGGLFNQFPEVLSLLSNIVMERKASFQDLNLLTTYPIVIGHEHEQYDQQMTRIIFKRQRINYAYSIRVRYVQWVDSLLKQDFTVTLCNPQEVFQGQLFSKKIPVIHNPIFMTKEDLGELAALLQRVSKIQRKHYQKHVDDLLSILPSA